MNSNGRKTVPCRKGVALVIYDSLEVATLASHSPSFPTMPRSHSLLHHNMTLSKSFATSRYIT